MQKEIIMYLLLIVGSIGVGWFGRAAIESSQSISHEEIRDCARAQMQEIRIPPNSATGAAKIVYNEVDGVMEEPKCAPRLRR